MKKEQINIRDPFVLYDNGVYYMYGTRAENFGMKTGGFDVYVSRDLTDFSEPVPCFDSTAYGLNRSANWAPEVHKYKGRYYMLATFEQESGLRGTYSLVSDSPLGPFVAHSQGALTPSEWECLDGTLYIDPDGAVYLVFCHEHTQISDGTICYVALSDTLDRSVGEPVVLFSASSCPYVDPYPDDHFVTDGPFFHRTKEGELYMIWSSFIKGNYAEMLVHFRDGRLGLHFEHLEPLIDSDGGHGMIFSSGGDTYFTYHTPNVSGQEHPEFCRLTDRGTPAVIEDCHLLY